MTDDRVTIATVVEGEGEVRAVPALIHRITHELGVYSIATPNPLRQNRSLLATPRGIESAVQLVAPRIGARGGVLVLFDADDDCPVKLHDRLYQTACAARSDRTVRLVLAVKEYECWFLAAAESLRGKCGLPGDLAWTGDPESRRGAKEWLSAQMRRAGGHPYKPTADQLALTRAFDLAAARERSPSFAKFCRDIQDLCS